MMQADVVAAAAPRIDVPPTAASRISLAPEFGRRFLLIGDAEEEFDWSQPLARENVAIEAVAALPEATRRFNAAGVIPTYVADYPVVSTAASAAAMADMVAAGACDIGTQLHPWVNPPYLEQVTPENSFTGNLPVSLQRAKLAALTDAIETATGVRPIVYRAGRYGIGPATAALLSEAGYRMDVSVRATFDYSAEGGPDFTDHPIWPWRIDDRLIEVPLTAAYTGLARRWPSLHRHLALRGPLARAGLLNRVALTPEGVPLNEALTAIRRLLADGTRLFSLSFHTPSVASGYTPYVRDAEELRAFWRWWDGVFNLFAREGVTACRPADVLAAA